MASRTLKPACIHSGYKGVSLSDGRWRALIYVHGKKIHLGCFDNPVTAAKAYDAAASKHFQNFARTNF